MVLGQAFFEWDVRFPVEQRNHHRKRLAYHLSQARGLLRGFSSACIVLSLVVDCQRWFGCRVNSVMRSLCPNMQATAIRVTLPASHHGASRARATQLHAAGEDGERCIPAGTPGPPQISRTGVARPRGATRVCARIQLSVQPHTAHLPRWQAPHLGGSPRGGSLEASGDVAQTGIERGSVRQI
jgi:hypothetical protein